MVDGAIYLRILKSFFGKVGNVIKNNAGIIGTTIGSIIAPGAGTAIGGALGSMVENMDFSGKSKNNNQPHVGKFKIYSLFR